MSEIMYRFEITPNVIDFGTRIIAVRHIAGIEVRRSRPFMLLGLVLMLVGGVLIGVEIVQDGTAALLKGGSTRIWVALVAAGLGIFAQVYQRRGLLISLSDRSRIRIDASRDDFLQGTIERLSEAMRAGPTARFHYAVDARAQTIEDLVVDTLSEAALRARPNVASSQAPPTPIVHTAPGGSAPLGKLAAQHSYSASSVPPFSAPSSSGTGISNRPRPSLNGTTQDVSAGPPPSSQRNSYVNGAGNSPVTARTPQSTQGPPSDGLSPSQFAAIDNASASQGTAYGSETKGAVPHGMASARRASVGVSAGIGHDLDALMEFVRRADVQHKDALLNLLSVVDDYAKGGPTLQDDAFDHWRSFAGYVTQYLSNIYGLQELTERAGRRFERR